MKEKKTSSKFREFIKTFLSFYMSADIDITSVAVAYYIIVSVFPALMLLASLLPYFQFNVSQVLGVIEELFPKQIYPTVANLVSTALTTFSQANLSYSCKFSLNCTDSAFLFLVGDFYRIHSLGHLQIYGCSSKGF